MQLIEITNYLESIAPLHLQESYDNSGLITGQHSQEINSILFSLDATEAIVEEAKQNHCNLIICHHPIIFSGLKRINGYHYVERAIIAAIKADIAIYAIHTNLDNVLQHGVNQKMASKLDLIDLQILRPKVQASTIGAGIIGTLNNTTETSFFLEKVKHTFQCKVVRHTSLLKQNVKRIAICGGSGSFLIKDAIQANADVLITSDLKYHEFFEANEQIILMDIGHFESEQYTIELLFDLISQKFTNFALRKAKSSTNPINYY